MLIRFKATGEESHVDNAAGRAFIASGLAEEVKKSPTPPPKPEWSIIYDESGYVAIKMEMGAIGPGAIAGYDKNGRAMPLLGKTSAMVSFYLGDPDLIHNRRDHTNRLYCSAFGREVPEDVIRQYRAARRRKPNSCAPGICIPVNQSNTQHALEMADARKRETIPVHVSEAEATSAQNQVPKLEPIYIPVK
jgi:hypothetical protein